MLHIYTRVEYGEICYNILLSDMLNKYETQCLLSILPGEKYSIDIPYYENVIEYGYKLNFESPWSINAKAILHKCGIYKIERIEMTKRIKLSCWHNHQHFDSITQKVFDSPILNFTENVICDKSYSIPIDKIDNINEKMGLSLDKVDKEFYIDLFKNQLKRDPTNVELFDLSQSNSEHSRHWFFNGELEINETILPQSLFKMVKSTLPKDSNSLIAFSDNSSAILGSRINTLIPEKREKYSEYDFKDVNYDIVFTAETHNFPTGIAPFPGAATGIGGRIRDNQAVGRGGLLIAGTAGYCVGNLFLDDYRLPWETGESHHRELCASPQKIIIEASNGASDYGNKMGEPIILGFARSFGLTIPNGERIEWLKPIMFTGGIGQMDHRHLFKKDPQKGMVIVKLGGPAYCIGLGGGSASSREHNDKNRNLDETAVQRGDPEMENKLNRVIRTCIEMGDDNPILNIHDQGAGGLGNVCKEIIYPSGGEINLKKVNLGDCNLSDLEIWAAEYQEVNLILIKEENKALLERISERENLPICFIGKITDSGKIIIYNEYNKSPIVDLDLETVLGKIPRKKYILHKNAPILEKFLLPFGTDISQILDKVFRLLSVGSKRFLVNKVDRSVTGLIAQQQCVGPLHTPLSDYAVVAQSHFNYTGAVTAIGEQPIKGLLSPQAMGELCIGEMLTNIMWVKVTRLQDIKCSGNWMWALKHEGEKYALYEACQAMCKTAIALGIAFDGGKDSLSMSMRIQNRDIKSPRSLVVSGYVTCNDIRKKVTSDFKELGNKVLFIDLGEGKQRMGGSAIAHVFNQIGDEAPNMVSTVKMQKCFEVVQELIERNLIVAGHDRSDGGLITTILESCFAGNVGIEIKIPNDVDIIEYLFNEELGIIIETNPTNVSTILDLFHKYEIPCGEIGIISESNYCQIMQNTRMIYYESINNLRNLWEETSFKLETLQTNINCAKEEKSALQNYNIRDNNTHYRCRINSYVMDRMQNDDFIYNFRPRVAILREEGSNGDREMASAFYTAGFQPLDVTIGDLMTDDIDIEHCRGMVFVGGFSYSDTFGAANGWYSIIRHNKNINNKIYKFLHRKDTFSLGVCNGCQLMSYLGIIPKGIKLVKNKSERFESRFSYVKINSNNSIMLGNMDDSILGVWVAHAEGRFIWESEIPDNSVLMQYVDEYGNPTDKYPFNPNGSQYSAAGVCSEDGRHLAMMPHPERTFLNWQVPWEPKEWRENRYYPWICMFQSAYVWVMNN